MASRRQEMHAKPFADRWDHIEAELRILDASLREILEGRRARTNQPDRVASGWGQGIFIGEAEIDALLPPGTGSPGPLRQGVEERVVASQEAGVDVPLARLARLFQLSRWELEVLVLCMAPEIDPRYERIYGYLHDDVSQRRPTAGLALDLLGPDLEHRASGRAAFGERRPLLGAGLLRFGDGRHGISRALELDPRISDFVLGENRVPETSWLSFSHPRAHSSTPAHALVELTRDTLRREQPENKVITVLYGDEPAARELADSVCAGLDAPLLVVDLPLLIAAEGSFEQAVREAAREAVLIPAAILVRCGSSLNAGEPGRDLRFVQLQRALDDFAWLAFVSAERPLLRDNRAPATWLSIEVVAADIGLRAEAWRAALRSAGIEAGDRAADALASRFRISPMDIDASVAAAKVRARVRGPEARPTLADVEAARRAATIGSMGSLAIRLEPRYSIEDIVLPRDQVRQLGELVSAIESRRKVLADWGFGAKLSRGRGISALFSGAPGTGKTMAAEIVAGELGLDVYAIDLSTVVSKYIGETERNLSRIFAAAESSSALLFFDEADALFGKRTEIKDAHDRHANVEISYLLQRMETFDGLVILATNLRNNLDDAMLRRLTFLVDFPFPDTSERLRIWRSLAPVEAPFDSEIDWQFLADRFPLAGGNIRGAVLHAAYQAAARNGTITMADLVLGIRRELDKMGKLSGASDFGPYWDQVVSGR